MIIGLNFQNTMIIPIFNFLRFLLLDDNNILRFTKSHKNGCTCNLCADYWNPFNGACACPGLDVCNLFNNYQFLRMICWCSTNTEELCECLQDNTKNSFRNHINFLEKIESLKLYSSVSNATKLVHDKNFNCCHGRKIQSFKCFCSCRCHNDKKFNVNYKAKYENKPTAKENIFLRTIQSPK